MFGDRLGYYNTELRPFTLADRIFSGRLSIAIFNSFSAVGCILQNCKILQILILQTIADNWPKIRHIAKNWLPIERKLSQLSAELNRFELRPLRAKISYDKVVRIIIGQILHTGKNRGFWPPFPLVWFSTILAYPPTIVRTILANPPIKTM